MNTHLREVVANLRAARAAYAASRLAGRDDGTGKAFTEACFIGMPDVLDALEKSREDPPEELSPSMPPVQEGGLGISPRALENVNFFLWIAMRVLSYLSMVAVFSIWFFTDMYSTLSLGQTVGAMVLFVVQAVVTFPDSILYERKDFERVRRSKTPLFRFSSSLLMIIIALFQFAVLAYAALR